MFFLKQWFIIHLTAFDNRTVNPHAWLPTLYLSFLIEVDKY